MIYVKEHRADGKEASSFVLTTVNNTSTFS